MDFQEYQENDGKCYRYISQHLSEVHFVVGGKGRWKKENHPWKIIENFFMNISTILFNIYVHVFLIKEQKLEV